MSISRSQIPNQIDAFDGGGDVTFTDDNQNELAMLLRRSLENPATVAMNNALSRNIQRSDFDTNYAKYDDLLTAKFGSQETGTNIYDVASQLGAGLLSTPNTGGASFARGLGIGFQKVSATQKEKEENLRRQRMEIAKQATQLAMSDTRSAEKFLDEMAVKLLGDTNKEIKTESIRYKDPKTGQFVERLLDKNDPLFKEIISDPEKFEASKITQPLVDMGGESKQYEKLNELTAKDITAVENRWQEESDAQVAVKDKNQAARFFANKLSAEDFGPLQLYTIGLKSVFLGLGFDGLIDEDTLANQITVNSLGTGLAMGLISQTKGSISDREMAMFLRASPTLGSTKAGFLQLLDLNDRISDRTIQFNSDWAKVRADMMKEGASLSEIRAAQGSFKADFHDKNPLFDFGTGAKYDDNLSVEDNLKAMDPNSEAYKIASQITEEGMEVYKGISAKHSTYGSPNSYQAQGIEGVPDGAQPTGQVFDNPDDPDDPRNGKPIYEFDGEYHVPDD
jgi:hypothetical protein